ncbi:MAG TPA: hypothetical protein DEP84_02870 [Chloroflexi bacterium]|nr:hypothetical protein [Chloroflexota bacterium]
MRLEGRVALITGSSRGIGRATALMMAREGADIVVNGRSEERIWNVVAEIESLGRRALAAPADVGVTSEVNAMVERAVETFGRIDILVNNAGGTFPAPYRFFLDYSLEDWWKVVDLNLTSQFLCCRAVVPHMKKNNWGRIIGVSSIAAVWGVPTLWSPAYCAAKAGVLGLTKQLALELGPYGITINAVSPVDTITERMEELSSGTSAWPESGEETVARYKTYPLRRLAEATEVASVILFLSSEEASYISGENLIVSGASYGRWAQSRFLQIEREKAEALRKGNEP